MTFWFVDRRNSSLRKFFRDLAQRGFQVAAFHVLDAAGFDDTRVRNHFPSTALCQP